MEVTKVRIQLVGEDQRPVLAFCTFTIDEALCIREAKIIRRGDGAFLAMPNRRLLRRCESCGFKNSLMARFCNECGGRQTPQRIGTDRGGRPYLYADVVHPVTTECRQAIQAAVLEAYRQAVLREGRGDQAHHTDASLAESSDELHVAVMDGVDRGEG